MKVFISYSTQDRDFVHGLAQSLSDSGTEVVYDEVVLRPGLNLVERLSEALQSADALLVVLSKASVQSEWVQAEVSTALFSRQIPVIPVLIEDCTVPTFLADIVWADFRVDPAAGLESLRISLRHIGQGTQREHPEATEAPVEHALQDLQDAFRTGSLTLVCGAGTSAGAGLPNWSTLLTGLLADMFKPEAPNLRFAEQLASELQERRDLSSLVIAQYLKSAFGDEFNDKVRKALYGGAPGILRSAMTDAIADLCRPRRGLLGLRGVVTYNFDDLIETALTSLRISYTSIFDEGQRCQAQTIPIYHAHGYLPRDSDLDADSTIVFAEAAYHSQFLEPFGWSNIVQLTELTQSTCLLIGISLTDPNLRRLLDVAARKGGHERHYIIWRRSAPLASADPSDIEGRLAVLNEQDANRLGLGVIWVNEFDEIPPLLDRIGHGS